MSNEKMFKFPKIENYIIIVLVILSLNLFIHNLNIGLYYRFSSDQVDTIFYISKNIPENNTILVPDLYKKNYLYDLLPDYDLIFLDNNKLGVYDIYKGILISMHKQYAIIDLTEINSKYLNQFKNDVRFKILYENNHNIVFKFR